MKNLSPFYDTFNVAIKNCWPMLILFVVIMVTTRLTKVYTCREKVVFYKEFYTLLALLYFLLLYYLLLSTEGASSGFNIIPFTEMTRYKFGSKTFIYNVIGNIVLFLPFGYIIADYLKNKKVGLIFMLSAIVSTTAEIIQYKIGRAFDVDDIILNVIGGILGYFIYKFILGIKNHLPRFLQNNTFYNLLAIIILIGVTILFASIWGVKIQ